MSTPSLKAPVKNILLRLVLLQMLPTRVRLLLSDGHSCYRPRRTGERKRKSVRGCIVAQDLSVLALSIVKQGEQDIPGLTDVVNPKRLGPKRATKIRKFFGLTKQDDVRCVILHWRRRNEANRVLENSSSDERCSPRRRVLSHTPRRPRSNDLSLLSECNTRDTESPSREDVPRLRRMLLTSTLQCLPSECTRSVRRDLSSERDVLHPCESRGIDQLDLEVPRTFRRTSDRRVIENEAVVGR